MGDLFCPCKILVEVLRCGLLEAPQLLDFVESRYLVLQIGIDADEPTVAVICFMVWRRVLGHEGPPNFVAFQKPVKPFGSNVPQQFQGQQTF